ncbi:MAG: hypothetical protein LBD21_03580 [Tannerellaceae bacterium]|jgi:hypothetical protein|nr:hypothetical protein [Tannerellaceae bacterium]
MKPGLIAFLYLLIPHIISATDYLRSADVRCLALGGNEVTFSPMFNPALTVGEPPSLQLNYFNRYAMKELGLASGLLILRQPALSGGIHIASFGYDAWRESMFRLALGKSLSDGLALGLSLQYAVLQTELYDEQPAQLSVDVGLSLEPVEGLSLGLLLMNYPSAVISADSDSRQREFMPPRIQVGVRWQAGDDLILAATLDCARFRTVGLHAGMAYRAFECLELRGGMELPSLLPAFGLGYEWAPLAVDAAAVYHPMLGFSYGVGVSYIF